LCGVTEETTRYHMVPELPAKNRTWYLPGKKRHIATFGATYRSTWLYRLYWHDKVAQACLLMQRAHEHVSEVSSAHALLWLHLLFLYLTVTRILGLFSKIAVETFINTWILRMLIWVLFLQDYQKLAFSFVHKLFSVDLGQKMILFSYLERKYRKRCWFRFKIIWGEPPNQDSG